MGKYFDLLSNSLSYFLRKSMKLSLENLYVDMSYWGLQS